MHWVMIAVCRTCACCRAVFYCGPQCQSGPRPEHIGTCWQHVPKLPAGSMIAALRSYRIERGENDGKRERESLRNCHLKELECRRILLHDHVYVGFEVFN